MVKQSVCWENIFSRFWFRFWGLIIFFFCSDFVDGEPENRKRSKKKKKKQIQLRKKNVLFSVILLHNIHNWIVRINNIAITKIWDACIRSTMGTNRSDSCLGTSAAEVSTFVEFHLDNYNRVCVWARAHPHHRPHPPVAPSCPCSRPSPAGPALSPSFSLRPSRCCTVTARGAVSGVLIKRQKKRERKEIGSRGEGEGGC